MRKALCAGTALVAGVAVWAGAAPAQDTQAQPAGLPDLVMRPISDVKAYPWYTRRGKKVKRRWAVRFTSIVQNVGPGQFVIHAHRSHVGKPCPDGPDVSGTHNCEKVNMTGDQLVLNADGTTTTFAKTAVVFFDPYHYHWHLRGANRYELRTLKGRLLSRDRKSGFCFGDRIQYVNPAPVEYPGLGNGLATCAYGTTDPSTDGRRALELTEGISAGYGDDYTSIHNGLPLEGQELELTHLKAGRYQLVNRTNATGKFHELTRANDASSVLFVLSWPRGRRNKPKIRVLASCAGKARCTKPQKQAPPPAQP